MPKSAPSKASSEAKRSGVHSNVQLLVGYRHEIVQALHMIRERFPANQFPEVTLQQINAVNPMDMAMTQLPRSCQLPLVVGVTHDAILSSVVTANHFFVQQPTHPTYPALQRLDMTMRNAYVMEEAPTVPNPAGE